MSLPTLARPVLIAAAAFAIGCSSTSSAGNSAEPGASSESPQSSQPAASPEPTESSDSAAAPVAIGQNFAMTPGQSVALPGNGSLRYVGVKKDSRCPPERQCVWAGDAEVAFEWSVAGAAAEPVVLHTGFKDKASKSMGGNTVSLVSLARGEKPEAQLRLEAAP